VTEKWADDAFSYFRALKDSSDPLSPFIGLLLSGFRGVRDYKQRIGSALYNIGSSVYLGPLIENETMALIENRCENEAREIDDEDVKFILEAAGGHPFLTQQTISAVLDRTATTLANVRKTLVKSHAIDFSSWWNLANKPDGCGPNERAAYRVVADRRLASLSSVAESARLSDLEALDALECLKTAA
jgi:hypothetical protein